MQIWGRLAALGLVLTLGVGCSSSPYDGPGDGPSTTPAAAPGPPAAAGCMAGLSEIEEVRFGPDDALGGYILGSGDDAVVLAHQSDGNACQMMPLARKLVAAGFTILAYDASGYGSSVNSELGTSHTLSDDAAYAAELMRSKHFDRVFLLGASMGGYAVLGAARQLLPLPDAIVSLSAPAAYGDGGPLLDLTGMKVPLLLIVARDDSGFVPSNQAFEREAERATLLTLSGSEHGVDLATPQVFQQIVDFLDAQR